MLFLLNNYKIQTGNSGERYCPFYVGVGNTKTKCPTSCGKEI